MSSDWKSALVSCSNPRFPIVAIVPSDLYLEQWWHMYCTNRTPLVQSLAP